MKNHKSTLLIVLLLLMGQGVYAQTVYYVDSASGNDSYSGNSPATAWRTLSHAGDSADSGAVVYIRAGTYGSWHPHSYTSWIRYPGDDQPVVTVYGGTGLNLDSRTDVLVKGLKFQGCDTAVKGTDATNCEIRECTIDYAGVYATASYTPIGHFDRCNYLYWIRDTAYAPGNNEYNGTRDSTQDGIHIEGCHYTLIDSCDFSDASHYLITPANADSTEEQPDRRDNLWTVVRHSNLHDAHGMLAPFSSSSYHLIEDNLLDNWQTWQDRAGAHLHLYSNYAIVRYNLVRHNLSNPVTQGPGNVNPVVDIWTDQYQSARHNHLYNNTIIATSPYSKTLFERVEGGSGVYLDYNVLKNNIFYGGYAGDPAIKYTYRYRGGHYSNWTHFTDSLATNLITSATTAWFRWQIDTLWSSMTLAQVQAGAGWATNNSEADPLINITTGELAQGSLAINHAAPETWTSAAVNDTNSIPVADAGYFFPGFPNGAHGVIGDSVLIRTTSADEKVGIIAISGNTLTMDRAITVDSLDPVYYYAWDKFVDNAPDIGAKEYAPGPPPRTPTLIDPANGQETLGSSVPVSSSMPNNPFVDFFWHSDAVTSDNIFELSLDNNFAQVLFRDTLPCAGGGYSKSFHFLEFETQYYWRVCARNEAGASNFTDPPWTFNTGPMPPPAPQVLLSPPNDAVGMPTDSILFKWKPTLGYGIISYIFGLYRDAALTDLVTKDTLPGTTFLWTSDRGELDYKQTYYWTVWACNEAGCSEVPAFERRRFRTGSSTYFKPHPFLGVR